MKLREIQKGTRVRVKPRYRWRGCPGCNGGVGVVESVVWDVPIVRFRVGIRDYSPQALEKA